MAELNINGRMVVKNFKKQFKEEFGGSLRVYKGQNFADDDATLASIRAEGCKGGELTLRANMLVGNFENKMQELFGIKVQVADADNKKLVDNSLTLGAVGRGEVKKKAERKSEVDSSITPKENSQEDMPIPASSPKWVELQLSVDAGYRLHLIPIIGEESNDMADEMIGNGEVDYGMVDDIECSLCDRDLGDYRLCFDFYNADEDHTWTDANGDVIEGVDENCIDININKGWFEEDGIEPDDNFKLIDKLVPGESLGNGDEKEIYNDIMARHNEGVDDEHVDIIKDAICRRMKQVSEQLVKDGLIDNADDARFILQFGVANECYIEYTVPVAGEFDSNLLRPLACEDWSDCSNVSEVMYEYMPDRLSELVIYDGKLYLGSCSASGDYNYQADIVNCDLESFM